MSEQTAMVMNRLHQAIESRDVDALLSLYADDAQLRIIDRQHPPSQPWDMVGKEAIAEHLRDVYSRDMSHSVQDEVIGDRSVAFTEACEYPDGLRVFASSVVQFQDGKIIREVELQEWDE